MNLAEFGAAYAELPPGEQALLAETVRKLLSDGFLWREDDADRQAYNFLRRRGDLVAAYLEVSGWKLHYDEPTRIYCLAHVDGAHRRHFGKKTTMWLLVLRLLYAEKREKPEASLTRYPVVTVGSLSERYAAFFPDQRVREKTSLDEALRALLAAKLIRAAGGGGLRVAEPDGLIELLPILEVIVPAQEVAALAERLQTYGPAASDEPNLTAEAEAPNYYNPPPMLSLTRIFLHNWHRFTHHLIEVEDSLYLAGHNGSGKSSVLDAIQLVLVAHQGRIQFNKLAQDQSDRDLDTYVRGKIGEDRWLRPGNTVAYVALEFSEADRRGAFTVGVCLEAAAGKSTERTFFIIPTALDAALFAQPGQALTRRELKKDLRERRGAKVFDQVGEYHTELLNRLGGLNERFADLFLRALHFRPIGKIDAFVEQWLLEKKALSLETLQAVRERLRDLLDRAARVGRQLEQLEAVTTQQREVLRLANLRDQYRLLVSLLRLAAAERRRSEADERLTAYQADLSQAERAAEETQVARAGAEAAVDAAKQRLYASDVARQRDELSKRVAQARQVADGIRERWQALRRGISVERKALAEIPEVGLLPSDDLAALRSALANLGELGETPLEVAHLQAGLDALLPILEKAADHVGATRVRLGDHRQQLRDRGDLLQREIKDLERQGAIRYRPEVERLQALLQPVVGVRPKLLCELLEVTETRWQNAVEAMLGARRFNIIVDPKYFDASVAVLDRARAVEKLYEVGLVDLERAKRETRPAQPGSLATLVTAATAAVGAYVNTVLGDIMAVETVADLRRHRRAVTPEVVAYAEFTLRAMRPERYWPNFIGQQARRSQIESRQAELTRLGQEWTELMPHYQLAEIWAKRLNRRTDWAVLGDQARAQLDDRALQLQITEDLAVLAALDLSGVAELEGEVRRLERVLNAERDGERQAIDRQAKLRADLGVLQTQRAGAVAALTDRQAEAQEARERWREVNAGAEALLAERFLATDLSDEVRTAESKAKEFETKTSNETEALTELGTAYNTTYQFAALPRDPRESRYAVERERLAATELPDYQSRIQAAQREADSELREHVLHTLREQIGEAKRKLDEINAALAKLPPFGHETYRFRYDRADDKPEFYDLVMADSQVLGRGPLFDSAYYREHQEAFDHFYDELTRRPDSEAERRDQERLTDYRRYLSYDVVVRDTLTGQDSRLSRIMNQTSGGETQTPFYLTIAASFVQLYHLGERSGRPTIRLVAFDEAFSKMDQERIGATLDLFQHFNLQIITATPLERCEYLVPKLCTSLVLTSVRDTVLIEPYRNYAARLNQADDQ